MRIKSIFITLICGIVFLGVGIFFTVRNKNYVETTAVITDIQTRGAGDDEDHDVYVSYNVDGQEYSALSDTYSSTYFEGKEISVFYNPDNPQEIHGDSKLLGIIMMAVGGVLMAITVIIFVVVIVAAKAGSRAF